MTIELNAPTLPESVPDGTIASWHKKAGETVRRDEVLVDIETDKVVIEVPSPADGVLKEIYKHAGDTVLSNEPIGRIEPLAPGEAVEAPDAGPAAEAAEQAASKAEPKPEREPPPAAGPAARRLMEENELDPEDIQGSGKGGRITRQDVLDRLQSDVSDPAPAPAPDPAAPVPQTMENRKEERVPMSRLRARVAQRLLEASNSTAMLTTFNEVNMRPVMEIRKRHQERFPGNA